MLELNAKTTALVVIDLQEGILPFAGGPHTADEVVNRAGKLAAKFRANGQPVFLVRVGWSADYAEALKQPVDAPSPAKVLPENWWQHPAALGATDSDIEIIKRHGGHTVHCPDATTNIIAGIMGVSSLHGDGVNITLGTDVGGGHSMGIYTQIGRAVQLSKLK